MGCLFSSDEKEMDEEHINLQIYEDSAFYSSETEGDEAFTVFVDDGNAESDDSSASSE